MRLSACLVTAVLVAFSAPVYAQLSLTSQTTTVDFAGFKSDGFTSIPSSGQLDSDAWSVVGLSDGNVNFGATGIGGDFSRGLSGGGATPGGIYAFLTPAGTVFGVQPTSSDFTPGSMKLAIRNDTGVPITSVEVSYTIAIYNDGDRSSSSILGHAPDNISYVNASTSERFSPGAADVNPQWFTETVTTTITGLAISNGGFLYLRWTMDDASGSGTRDEIGLLDVTIIVPDLCTFDSDCDDALACNGTETCSTGLCQSGTPLADDGISCTVDNCDENTLITTNIPTNSLCTNGLFCDGEEVCDPMDLNASINGCVDGPPVDFDDGVPCTLDSCDESADVIVNSRSDAFCTNTVFCDGEEICLPNDVAADLNGCVVGVPPASDDAIACTDDSCDEVNDTIVNALNDNNCDDLLYCNGVESCDPLDGNANAQGCVSGTDIAIDDAIDCTDDLCDENTDTVTNIPNDVACSDGLFCSGVERCQPLDPTADSGGCIGGIAPETDDGVDCTIDICDETLGAIVNGPDHASCADVDACTTDLCDGTLGCTNAVSGCTISGTCFGDGTVNPFNRCEVCDITKNFDDWIAFPEDTVCAPAQCNTNDELRAENLCNDRGECVLPIPETCVNGCSNAACNADCVTDADCDRGWCDVNACRTENRVPTVTLLAPLMASASIGFVVEADAEDLDGDALTFVWSSNDTDLSFESINAATTTATAVGGERPVEIQVVVSDGEAMVSDVVIVRVNAENEDVGTVDVGMKTDVGDGDAGADSGRITSPRASESGCSTAQSAPQFPFLIFLIGLIVRRRKTDT